MVNDTVMEKDMIPVKVGEKVYYGCCSGCVSRLQEDEKSRYSEDPVSKNRIDKADAVIYDNNGKAVYFESEENMIEFINMGYSN